MRPCHSMQICCFFQEVRHCSQTRYRKWMTTQSLWKLWVKAKNTADLCVCVCVCVCDLSTHIWHEKFYFSVFKNNSSRLFHCSSYWFHWFHFIFYLEHENSVCFIINNSIFFCLFCTCPAPCWSQESKSFRWNCFYWRSFHQINCIIFTELCVCVAENQELL